MNAGILAALASRSFVARLCREEGALPVDEQRLVDEAAAIPPSARSGWSALRLEVTERCELHARIKARHTLLDRERESRPFRRAARTWLRRGGVPLSGSQRDTFEVKEGAGHGA